jgi:hypothetical protein
VWGRKDRERRDDFLEIGMKKWDIWDFVSGYGERRIRLPQAGCVCLALLFSCEEEEAGSVLRVLFLCCVVNRHQQRVGGWV